MKRFLFFFLILFTWYMAAMYRLQSLMALAVAEIILLFLLFSDQIFEKKFDCRILREQSDIEKRGKDGNKNLDRKFLCFSGGKIQTGVYPGLKKK